MMQEKNLACPPKGELTKLAYTVDEATAALGIGKTSLYQLIKDKKLPTSKVAGRTLIKKRDLEALLDGGRHEG